MRKGDTLTLALNNDVEFYVPVLAAWICEMAISPTYHDMSPEHLAEQFRLTESRAIVCEMDFLEQVQKAVDIAGSDITIYTLGSCEGSNDIRDMYGKDVIDDVQAFGRYFPSMAHGQICKRKNSYFLFKLSALQYIDFEFGVVSGI